MTAGPSRPSSPGPMLRKGQLLDGRYEVRDKASADRFAVNLVGLDKQTDERVFIRVLRPGVLADEKSRQETLERLRAMIGVGGRFLPGLRAAGIEGSMLFIVEAIPRGTSVRGLLARRELGARRLSPDEGLVVATRLEAAMAAIPEGHWHGDVNPSHIWISRDGLTLSGAFLIPSLPMRSLEAVLAHDPATARRFAPEVGRGEGSRASDLYSAAQTLYEALAGEMAPGPGMPPPDGMGKLGEAFAAMMKVEPSQRPGDMNPLLAAVATHAKRPLKKLDPAPFRPALPTPLRPPAPAALVAPAAPAPPAPPVAPAAPASDDEWDDATSVYSGEEAAAALQEMASTSAAEATDWESESTDTDAQIGRVEAPVMDVDTLTGAKIAVGSEPKAAYDDDGGWDDDATQQFDLDELLNSPEVLPQESIPTPLPPAPAAPAPRAAPPARPTPAASEEPEEMMELELEDVEESTPVEPRKKKRPPREVHKPDLSAMNLKPIPRARAASIPPPAAVDGVHAEHGVLFDDSLMGEFEPTDPGGALPGAPPEHPEFSADDFDEPSIPPDAPEDMQAPPSTPPRLQNTVVPAPKAAPIPKPRSAKRKSGNNVGTARRTIIGALVVGIVFISLAIGYQIYQQRSADDARQELLRQRLELIQAEEQN